MKIVMAQFPLEVHSRGMITVSKMLRDAGHEVLALGNARPKEIVQTLVDEDCDAIGISTYCGGEVEQAQQIVDELNITHEWGPIKLFIGGVIPTAHIPKLEAMGFQVYKGEALW